jgi:hypothetical protein
MKRKHTLILTLHSERVRQSHYLRCLDALIRARTSVTGRVSVVTVRHDDWCPLLTDRGACNCHPELVVEEVKP